MVTNLGVLDFKGPNHGARVIALHPGVTFEEVQGETGFPLIRADNLKISAVPTEDQLAIIRKLDPTGIRASVIKGNPPGLRAS